MKRALLLSFAVGCILLSGTAAMNIPMRIGGSATAQQLTAEPAVGDVISQLGERFETIAARVSPAVVSVEAVKPAKTTANGKGRPTEESGSGVIIKMETRPGYFVLTNNHVISQARSENITIHLADGRVLKPGRIWTDPETDIALLSLDGAVQLPVATLGNSDNAKVGRWVLAIGSPFGLNQTVTHGIISARERGQVSLGNAIRIKDFLQTDAAINPGSSGGPLVDMRGEVIGINTAIASNHGSNSGVAFSIPINLVKRITKQMVEQGTVARGYLGMQVAATFEPNDALRVGLDRVRGALVERVYPETPAAAAGMRPNDVVLQVDSVAIRNDTHLINLVAGMQAGQRIRMQVWRDRNVVTLDAVIGDWGRAQGRFREP
jgi:S1-C subfamily serine protease